MINPKELRLGNLILDEIGNEITIDTFVELCSNCAPFIDPNKCNPIPLTEEWLERFGFEYKNLGYVKEIYISKYEGFFCFGFVGFDIDKDVELKYVHQLQNLYFSLTGEELTIK